MPSTFGSTTTSETLHWDGDTILFVTNAAGAVTDVKVGLDGDITPHDVAFTGLSVYDRDPAGVVVETSDVTGSTGFNPLNPTTVNGTGSTGTTGYQAAVVPYQYVRGDGFMVAGVQINGVRAFDPNIGAWTTPDAYEGDVHDPASQQRYMFDRGNAVDYDDPTGYCGEGQGIPKDWQVETTKYGDGWRFKDPLHKGDQVRVMRGNPNSPNAVQRAPYVRWTRSGKFLDRFGQPTNPGPGQFDEASHIPWVEFKYTP